MKIRWTKKAIKNLEQFERFIAQDKPDAAIETVLNVIHAVEYLVDHPQLGRIGRIHGTRELIVSGLPVIVPYRIKDQYVEILRVMHSTIKWPERL